MRRTAAVMVVALGALVLGACGDDDDDSGGGDVSEEEQPYVDALVASMQSDDDGDFTLTAEQAECVAPRWVDTIGVERMRDAGIEPEDIGDDGDDELDDLGLNEDEGGELFDAFGDCDVDITSLFIDELAADADITDEDRECLEENFDDDLLRRIMVTTLASGDDALEQDEDLMGELFDVFSECPGAAN